MLTKWQIGGLVVILIVAAMGLNEQYGLQMAIMLLCASGGIVIALIVVYHFAFQKASITETGISIRGGIKTDEAKYIAAKHLQLHHHADIFAHDAGVADPHFTRYRFPLHATRCYPKSGEEAWMVRVRVHHKDMFSSLPTKVIIYIDGDGNVIDDPVMNADTFLNETIWKKPELYFREFPPKTPTPRSIKEVIANQISEEGGIPPEMGAKIIEQETAGMEKKIE